MLQCEKNRHHDADSYFQDSGRSGLSGACRNTGLLFFQCSIVRAVLFKFNSIVNRCNDSHWVSLDQRHGGVRASGIARALCKINAASHVAPHLIPVPGIPAGHGKVFPAALLDPVHRDGVALGVREAGNQALG